MSLPAVALLLVRALPTSPATALARCLVLAYLLFRRDCRREITRNCELLTGRADHWFWLRNGWAVGRNLALMAGIGTRRTAGLIDRATICADNLARQILERELHISMASLHFGVWEMLPQVFASKGTCVAVVTGRQRDRGLRAQLRRIRSHSGVVELCGLRAVLDQLAAPGLVGFMLDNTNRGQQGQLAIGGLRMRVPLLAFQLAERAGLKLLPVVGRLVRGRLWVHVGNPGSREEVVTQLLEQVRNAPEEWVLWAKAGALSWAA